MDQKILNLNKLYSGKNVPTVRPPLVIGTLASTGWSDARTRIPVLRQKRH